MKKKLLLLILILIPLMVGKVQAAVPQFFTGDVATADISLIDACIGDCQGAHKEGC